MYVFLVLFFLSLSSIVFMVGRKLALVKNGQGLIPSHEHPFVPDLLKLKYFTIANARKAEHAALVAALRFYVRSLNMAKSQYRQLRTKIAEVKNRSKNIDGQMVASGEVSKFLRMI